MLKSSRTVLSRTAAQNTIRKGLAAGLGVTVQTLVSSQNDNLSELIDLRTGLWRMVLRIGCCAHASSRLLHVIFVSLAVGIFTSVM